MHEIYLGLGSNLGDRILYMMKAVEFIRESGKFADIRVSSLYETDPVGYTDQPPFLNAVFYGKTDLSPRELLETCQAVEAELERVRVIHWGPRTIDADILLYDMIAVQEPDLEIPHSHMFERGFVLIPLIEICSPETSAFYNLPDCLAALEDQGIRKLGSYEAVIEQASKFYAGGTL